MFRGAGWNVIKVDLGRQVGRAADARRRRRAAQPDERDRRRRVPALRGRVRRLRPRALLRPRPAAAQAGRAPVRRGDPQPAPRRPRLPEALRRLQGRHRAARRAHGHPRQDDQGLDARPRRRGPQRHPPDQEDDHRPAPARSASGSTSRTRCPRTRSADDKEPPYIQLAEDSRDPPVHARPAPGARRLAAPPRRAHQAQARAARPRRPSTRCSAARASRRRRPPPRSPGCSATCAATRSSARASCRSSPTRPAPSAWTRCSRSSGSTRRRASSTSPSTTRCCSPTRRASSGQILEEGITEAGSMASFIAAGTSYATHGVPMVPFFTFYSMFGFQRVGDLIWQASDARARGFLLGATAGRTTLLGEGLQHQDGHSLLLASVNPVAEAYDPAFAYEVATIVRHGLRRMWLDERGRLLLPHPLQREPRDAGRCPTTSTRASSRASTAGRRRPTGRSTGPRSCSPAPPTWRPARRRRELAEHYDVAAELWSATSYKRLREQALTTERWNRLHPDQAERTPRVTELLDDGDGPDRRRHRLHEGGARPDRPLGARRPPLHAARHRRLRPQRHPRGAAPPLRDRRAPRRRRHPGRAGRRAAT